jgi:hypothetical protein
MLAALNGLRLIPFHLLFIILLAALFAGCGGGGGGGGGGGSSGPTILYVGTTAFNPATSRGLSGMDTAFSVPDSWAFRGARDDVSDPGFALESDQTFTLSSVTISGTALPCYRVEYVDSVDSSGNLYEWWAVGTDGGLYRLTKGRYDVEPNPDDGYRNNDPAAPVLLSQAKLILPGSFTVGTTWTVGASPALNLDNSSLGHRATRTVVSLSAASPHGFPGCLKVKVESTATTDVWYEYWMDGAGLVEIEVVVTSPTPGVNYNWRSDISTSG